MTKVAVRLWATFWGGWTRIYKRSGRRPECQGRQLFFYLPSLSKKISCPEKQTNPQEWTYHIFGGAAEFPEARAGAEAHGSGPRAGEDRLKFREHTLELEGTNLAQIRDRLIYPLTYAPEFSYKFIKY